MPDISALFPSHYLKATDAQPSITVTIRAFGKEKMKNKEGVESEKNVVFFEEFAKGMVLNITNANILADIFESTNTDDFIGKRVTLGTEILTAFGQTGPALRFKALEVHFDRAALLARYQKLYEEARAVGVDHLDTFVIDPKTTSDASLIEMGKILRDAVEIVKADPFK